MKSEIKTRITLIGMNIYDNKGGDFFVEIWFCFMKSKIKTRMSRIGTKPIMIKKRGFFLEFGFAL